MKVIKLDKDGNQVLGPDGKPVMIEVPDDLVVGDKVISVKPSALKSLQDELEEQTRQRDELAARLDAEEKKRKEREMAALPVEQQTLHRLTDLESQIARERAERARQAARHEGEIRQLGLVAYRERALRDVPGEMHDLINGASEAEIDRAVDFANRTHSVITDKIRREFEAATQQPHVTAPGVPLVQQQQVPPNPAYVVPTYQVPPGAPLGLPTPTNAQQVVEGSPANVDLRALTSEGAVRNGRYSGEMREKILAAVRQNGPQYAGTPGASARHLSQPAQQLPGGVTQPMGLPTPPVNNPQYQMQQPPPPVQYAPQPQYIPNPYYQPAQYILGVPQYTPQPVPQSVPQPAPAALPMMPNPLPLTPGQQAAAAVARTHAGANPLVSGEGAAALVEAHNHAGRNSIQSPQAAFQQRFVNTPPEPGSN